MDGLKLQYMEKRVFFNFRDLFINILRVFRAAVVLQSN